MTSWFWSLTYPLPYLLFPSFLPSYFPWKLLVKHSRFKNAYFSFLFFFCFLMKLTNPTKETEKVEK